MEDEKGKIVEIFKKTGLTDYQSRVLSVLIKEQNLTAQEISEESDIPYTKIYSVLSSLEKEGYIESNFERPKKYRTLPPESLIEEIQENKEKELESLEEYLETKQGYLKEVYSHGELEDISVWLCPSRESLINEILSFLPKTEEELVFASRTFWKEVGNSKDFLEGFRKMQEKEVDMKALIPSQADIEDSKAVENLLDVGFEVRKINENRMTNSLIIMDKQKCGLPIKKDKEIKADKGLRIDNKLLAGTFYVYFENLWEESEPIESS